MLWRQLEQLMRQSAVDWTLFWRQLAVVAAAMSDDDDGLLVEPLQLAFYSPLTWTLHQRWAGWLRRWRGQHAHEGVTTAMQREALADRMRQASPKYIPREWMLAEAYTAAGEGDHSAVHRLQELFRRPYDEQAEFESRYYRRAPDRCGMTRMTVPHEMRHGLTTFIVFLQCDKTRRDCVHELIVLAPSATMCNRIANAARAIEGMPCRP